MGHTEFVVVAHQKKRHDTGHPKCLVCALADVPAGAPLLKVYAYGPFGARFFCRTRLLYGGTAGQTDRRGPHSLGRPINVIGVRLSR